MTRPPEFSAPLQALRVKIGDRAFLALLKTWTTKNAGGNVSTADFVSLAEKTSGQSLQAFFQTWIYDTTKPTTW